MASRVEPTVNRGSGDLTVGNTRLPHPKQEASHI